MSHPRRQQLRHTARAVGFAGAGAALGVLAVVSALGGRGAAAIGAAVACAVALMRTWQSWDRAVRNRIGADAERDVARALDDLARNRGWKVRHGVRWRGPGDIDHVAAAPGGQRFVIETKTLRYDADHLTRIRTAARTLGAVPVLCIARKRGACRIEDDVLIVSLDRLAEDLSRRAGSARG